MVRMTREEKRQETLGRLRQAALQEFAQCGLEGTSIDRITAAAGYSRGAFYGNYSAKEELLLELLQQQTAREIAAWQQILAGSDDLESIYARTGDLFLAFLRDGDWGVFAAEVQLHARRHAAFATEYRAFAEEVVSMLAGLIDLLFAKAGRRPPADAGSIARLLRGMVSGLSLDAQSVELSDRGEDAAALLMLFLRTLVESGSPVAARSRPRSAARATTG
jgi:AcrR family transcriptional regulator